MAVPTDEEILSGRAWSAIHGFDPPTMSSLALFKQRCAVLTEQGKGQLHCEQKFIRPGQWTGWYHFVLSPEWRGIAERTASYVDEASF